MRSRDAGNSIKAAAANREGTIFRYCLKIASICTASCTGNSENAGTLKENEAQEGRSRETARLNVMYLLRNTARCPPAMAKHEAGAASHTLLRGLCKIQICSISTRFSATLNRP